MPEGDTLFRAARALDRALRGETIERFETAYPALARVELEGRVVEGVSAAGKHLLMRLSGGLVLRTHLRMNGAWHLYRPDERWRKARSRARIVLATRAFLAVGFDVPEAELLGEQDLKRSVVGRLGPDLLGPEFDLEEALRRLRARPDREMGQALLDQTVMAGVGNEYKSELLFICRIHPCSPVSAVGDAGLRKLVEKARELLCRNVAEPMRGAGRWTTGSMDPARRAFVYGRTGRPCPRCGTAIAWARHGSQARSTWWCPRCQPLQQTT
ncbi:MAG TPA: DNA-formamidopyrimidine glycosylase family protein [Myxococcales bacterium]|jgi:endonuclease-8